MRDAGTGGRSSLRGRDTGEMGGNLQLQRCAMFGNRKSAKRQEPTNCGSDSREITAKSEKACNLPILLFGLVA